MADDSEELIEDVDEDIVDDLEGAGQGQAALLSHILRGQVQYAYFENDMLTLMYENPKRMLKIDPAKQLVVNSPYYTLTRH
jgi:hypothetical protein